MGGRGYSLALAVSLALVNVIDGTSLLWECKASMAILF